MTCSYSTLSLLRDKINYDTNFEFCQLAIYLKKIISL